MEALHNKTIFNSYLNNTLQGNIRGLVLAVVVGVLAHNLTNLPLLSVPGPMLIAILVGIAWRAVMGIPENAGTGISLASKKLLRLGVILMGVRLNLLSLLGAGTTIMLLDAGIIILAISVICYLGKRYGVEKKLTLLTAVGTGICGAAAIAAISPIIKSDEDETVVSVATVALLGTVFSILYIILQPHLGIDIKEYGIFAGATLHEVAHTVAAAQPLGTTAGDMAILTKLGRVAFLIPVTLIISLWFNLKGQGDNTSSGIKQVVIPWFIFGFFGMALLNTAGLISEELASMLLQASGLLLTVAMAGMGLSVDLAMFKRKGLKSLAIGFAGTVVISITGLLVIKLMG